MAEKIWDCGCIDAEDWEKVLDGINSELRYNERAVERGKMSVKLNSPGASILLNSAKTERKNLSDLRDKIESMTLCEMDDD